MCLGLAKYHGTDAGGERKPRRSPSAITRPRRNSSPKKPRDTGNALKRDPTGCIRQAKPKRSNGPLFKDPKARSKLEMIKSIRAQRAASETSTIEAINRARFGLLCRTIFGIYTEIDVFLGERFDMFG